MKYSILTIASNLAPLFSITTLMSFSFNSLANEEVDLLVSKHKAPIAWQASSASTYKNVDGIWQGTLHEERFKNSITMTIDGNTLHFQGTNQRLKTGYFSIDETKTPHHLNILWDSGSTVFTVIERIDSDTLKIENSPKRPDGFSAKAMIFKRVVP